jgi:DNA helicase-2/ATP-dependent DNA helicase PcrA
LIESGVAPEHILAVTFTNKAATEMRERIEELISHSIRGLWIGTFHSIAARLLRRESSHTSRDRWFTIYDKDDSARAIKEVMEALGHDPKLWSPRSVQNRISSAKNSLVGADQYTSSAFDVLSGVVADVYPAYETMLNRRNAYDFDDLLFECVKLLEGTTGVADRYASQFIHVLVDEYQDTNHAQYRMVKAFAARHRNLCVVGDDDQSIYAWRGADLNNILDFERDFEGAHVVRLERNYRSTRSILEVANAVIECNVERKPKRLRTERETGRPVQVVHCADERQEASWVASEIERLLTTYRLNNFAILYRTNAQSRAFEEAFRRQGLPYRIVGGVPFYERREIKDVLGYLRLVVNRSDDAAFQRAITWPRRGVGTKSLERLTAFAMQQQRPLFEVACRVEGLDGISKVACRGLRKFTEGCEALRVLLPTLTAKEALEGCIETFGLASALSEEEDGAERLENVNELLATTAMFVRESVEDADPEASNLELYLQSAALRSDLDEQDFDSEAITFMTLHNAKGLEFPIVFLTGLEEGLFPLTRALESEGGLEEERRLFYVGVTRAMDLLALSHVDQRWRAGMQSHSISSSFLGELPAEHLSKRVVGRSRSGRSKVRKQLSGGHRPLEEMADIGPSLSVPGGSSFSWHRETFHHPESVRDYAQEAGEVRYDYGDSQVLLELSPGAQIIHPQFGPGEIVKVYGAGQAMKAEIDFEKVGRKKVLVAHARLRPS